jgi:dATP pyrophosphohydrolase
MTAPTTRAPFQVLVLPWRRGGAGLEVAALRRADYDLWQFVSGGGELGETPEAAARREATEEAGLPPDAPLLTLDATATVPACWFTAWPSWPADVLVVREHAFAVEVGARELTLSPEHRELRWCGVPEAMELLRFDSNRTALWELHERLFPGPRVKRPAFR